MFPLQNKACEASLRPIEEQGLAIHVNDILEGLEKVTCRHVRPGRVEVHFLCHEAELGIATLFDEPIQSKSANAHHLRAAAKRHE